MFRTILIAFCCVSGIVIPVQAQEPTTFEEVLKKIGESAEDISSWSADMDMTTSVGGMSMSYTGDMTGRGEEVAMNASMNMGGQQIDMRTVTDNTGMQWIETNMGGIKQIMKMDTNVIKKYAEDMPGAAALGGLGNQGMNTMSQNPKDMLEMYGNLYKLDYVGTETLEGTKVYKLAGAIDENMKASLGQQLETLTAMGASMDWVEIAVGAEDGFVRRVAMGAKDAPFLTMQFNNVKLNPTIPDGTFTYSPPEGAHVMDMTSMIESTLKQTAGTTGDEQ